MPTTTSSYGAGDWQALPSLLPSGAVPTSRVTSPDATRDLVNAWLQNDRQGRSGKRARVTGLIQGNPPNKSGKLRAEGRADATNINFRTAEAHEEAAKNPIYDLFAEAPTFTTVELEGNPEGLARPGRRSYGASSNGSSRQALPPALRAFFSDPAQVVEGSRVVTEEFDILQKSDPSWDSVMQNSQRETVRYGAGPITFRGLLDWRVCWVPYGYLQTPDDAPSDVNRWECCAIIEDLYAHELYGYIRNPEAAAESGWNVEAVRQAILSAAPDIQNSAPGGLTWEWVQQQLKQDSFSWSARSKVIKIANFYAREFPEPGEQEGKITHVIIVLSPAGDKNSGEFLYRHNRCYSKWQECVHPMYHSQGEGGKHYGVTGQGVRMYGPMELENRLLCNMADKSLAPKIMFKPTTASNKQRLLPKRYGDYAVLPEGFDMQQVALNSMLEEGMLFHRVLTGVVSANLSTYRSNLENPKSGNPITAEEASQRAVAQASLGRTQINKYYEQLDWLYEEKYRRACNPSLTAGDPGGSEALAFQARCEARGVPKEALLYYACVKATRVAGQGSPYLRQQAFDYAVAIAGALPEEGRERAIKGALASRFGSFLADYLYPTPQQGQLASDHLAEAMQQVAAAKVGIAPVVTSSQNPAVFAGAFLQAGFQALESLQQAQGPGAVQQAAEVLSFLRVLGPAIMAHLQRFASDPTRQGLHKQLTEKAKELATATARLAQQVSQVFARQRQAQQKQMMEQAAAGREALQVANGQDPALVVGLAGVERKAQLDQAKAASQAKLKAEKQQVSTALSVAKTSADIRLADAKTAATILQDQQKADAAAEAAASKPSSD